ncbi:glycosyltransferase [Pleurocapsales cyanobacterium LEGE 06147]|nr:glycosyltransferase [Pleurocapsales cyanobacterium LEGE 06147]
MKILIVIPALGTVYGGPSKSVVELVQAVGNQGIEVDIVTTNANGFTKLDFPLCRWIKEKDYRIQYFPYWAISDYKISFSLTQWLFEHVQDYDLVHTNAIFSYTVLPAYWACQRYRVPYIITPRGMLEPWALSYKAWKKRLYYALLEKPALNQANAIQMLASNEAQRTRVLNLKSPLVIVPNGVHRHDFETLPDPGLFYQKFPETCGKSLILFLGRVDPKKGLDLLAKAFAQIYSQFPHTHLIVAGPDNVGFLPTAKNYFAETGCLDAVTFTGMLTGKLKYAALAAVSIYIAPSYSEGFSMSVLEGMASGLPCVITTGCNFAEAAQAKAAHVVDINAEAIANALIECLQHPQRAKEMGDRARQLILEQYTWDKIAAKMIEIYQAILNGQDLAYCL